MSKISNYCELLPGEVCDIMQAGDWRVESDQNKEPAEALKLAQCKESQYFNMYGRIELHEWLLKDTVRNKAYREAICNNEEAFKGKTVLDIGCGTGILSLFAAKAGAAKVIAVDASTIVDYARRIVQDNNYASTITVIGGKIENIELPDGMDNVDIIVCDWMGNCLYSEGMLNSVIFARDKWLAPGGLIFPDTAKLYLLAITQNIHRERDLDYWHDVYGFDMSVIRRSYEWKAIVEHVDPQQLFSDSFLINTINLYTASYPATNFRSIYELKLTRNGSVHALLAFFDVSFSKTANRIGFSTSPRAPWTHWNQTVFYLDAPLPVKAGDFIKGVFGLKACPVNKRDLYFDIYVGFESHETSVKSNNFYVLCNAPIVGGT